MNEPRRSAALVLTRTTERGLEAFLVERSARLKHWGGHWAFPGGAVDPEDASTPLAGAENLPGEERELIACAARELFEELGILAVAGAQDAGAAGDARRLREELLRDGDHPGAFPRWLSSRSLTVDAARFRLLARWITPRFARTRFDTCFFHVEAAGEPLVLEGELVRGEWWSPRDALDEWRRGKMPIVPPVLDILDSFGRHGVEATIDACRSSPSEFERSDRSVRLFPGYEIVPVETPPLPADIPTNVFLVGWKRFVLIDPAPRRETEQQHLFHAVDRRIAQGDELLAVVLTHHHPDHVGALEPAVERYRVPVWGHRKTGELLKRRLDRELGDGDRLELGSSPDGREGWSLQALFTPGHAEGHLVFHDERHGILVAADLVSTLVSMYVGAPGGNLREYFASMERVQGVDLRTLLPSHGTPTTEPQKLLRETVQHRKARIEEAAALLSDDPQEALAVALRIYPGGAGKLRPLVERTTRAALEYLVEEGRAERVGSDAFRRAPGRKELE